MANDFNELLATPMDDIKRPPPLPTGTYHGIIAGHEFGKSSRKQTSFVQYNLTLLSAGEDVDQTQLEGIDLTKRPMRATFYLTEAARYRVKEFLESVGVDVTGRSLGECIPDANNARVLITVTQRNSEDGKEIYNDVGEVKGEE